MIIEILLGIVCLNQCMFHTLVQFTEFWYYSNHSRRTLSSFISTPCQSVFCSWHGETFSRAWAKPILNMHFRSQTVVPLEEISKETDTISSLCNWWNVNKDNQSPGICHWFHNAQRNISLENDFLTKTTSVVKSERDNESATSISLLLMFGGIFGILIASLIVSCLTRKERVVSQVHC